MVVDDNEFNVHTLGKILVNLDIRYEYAFNGFQAIELAEQYKDKCNSCFYKVILMDCDMPIMDGLETTRMLRVKMGKKEIPNCKIFACTAFVEEKDHKKCL